MSGDAAPQTPPNVLCGNGLPQPAWGVCREPGVQWIDGYEHPYCMTHAAARLRARAALWGRR